MSDPGPQQDNARSVHDQERRYYLPHKVIKNMALEAAQFLMSPGNPTGIEWNIDQSKTSVMIVDKHSFNLDQVESTPAIVANRGPQAWAKSSGFRQIQSIDMRTDRRTYTDLVRGSVVLSCFSREGEEAETVAGYLFESFQVFRDVLRKLARQGTMYPHHLGFFRIEATSMGEEALVKSDSRPNLSVVPVSISASVQRRYAVEPRNTRKLKDIVTRVSGTGL